MSELAEEIKLNSINPENLYKSLTDLIKKLGGAFEEMKEKNTIIIYITPEFAVNVINYMVKNLGQVPSQLLDERIYEKPSKAGSAIRKLIGSSGIGSILGGLGAKMLLFLVYTGKDVIIPEGFKDTERVYKLASKYIKKIKTAEDSIKKAAIGALAYLAFRNPEYMESLQIPEIGLRVVKVFTPTSEIPEKIKKTIYQKIDELLQK